MNNYIIKGIKSIKQKLQINYFGLLLVSDTGQFYY